MSAHKTNNKKGQKITFLPTKVLPTLWDDDSALKQHENNMYFLMKYDIHNITKNILKKKEQK